MKLFKRLLISTTYMVANQLVALLGLFVLAVVLPFISRSSESLPKPFRWWDNGELYFKDKDAADGLSGPDYWREARGTTDNYKLSYFKLLWERYHWCALRNPANYFGYVTGIKVVDKLEVIETNGKMNVGDHIWNTSGTYKLVVKNGDGKEYWEYYAIKNYYKNYIFRARIGWKIRDPLDDVDGKTIPSVFSINPFKKIN